MTVPGGGIPREPGGGPRAPSPGERSAGSDLLEADVLVVGSGIAGLTFALKMARHGDVLLVTKKERAESNTNFARGGIAAVLGGDDELGLHIRDTFVAGAGLCHAGAVGILVREGPQRVRELVAWGTRFDRDGGDLSLGREGGHSRRRIVHAGDRTGRAIESALLDAVEAESRIRVLEDHLAVDLLMGESRASPRPVCRGAVVLDHRHGRIVEVRARVTMLATGGCGQVYRHTTNPSIATGDGVAMAYRAGARVANMEFVQFHPTALYPTDDPAFLISEALRGEGAVLRTLDGVRFMERAHPLGSLAPRDVVARAIDSELKERGEPHVVLDVSAISRRDMEERFPAALEGCRARGLDPWEDGIPVVPAAHYACGGVLTDAAGATAIPGLYATGEVACTGVHGANRLASNSLLEAVVFSHRASVAVAERLVRAPLPGGEPWIATGGTARELSTALDGPVPPAGKMEAARARMRVLMWEQMGIVRSDARLEAADEALTALVAEHEGRWRTGRWTAESAELRNLLQTAELVVRSAFLRRESRGLHFNLDHPWRDNERYLRDTVISL